jgi:hypothetical protein
MGTPSQIELSPELAAIAAEASGAPGASPAAEASAAQADPAAEAQVARAARQGRLQAEIGGLLDVVVRTLRPALPSVAALYTPEVVRSVSEVTAALCVKHGWLSDGLFGAYQEEIAAAVVLVPLAISTREAALRDIEALRARKRERERAAAMPAAEVSNAPSP